MCEWGTDVEVDNLLTPDGERRAWKIDACIASIVEALNAFDIFTTQSCCGHGKGPGRIDLEDGRVLVISTEDFQEVRAVEKTPDTPELEGEGALPLPSASDVYWQCEPDTPKPQDWYCEPENPCGGRCRWVEV